MIKICLVYPKSMRLPRYFNFVTNIATETVKTLPPLGMLYLISNTNYKVDFIDNRIQQYDTRTLCEKLSEYDMVGFGGTIFEIKEARTVSSNLMRKGIFTVYGGPNATANWNLYLTCFSMIVRGEGEEILSKIIDCYNSRASFEKIGFSIIGSTWVNEQIFRLQSLDTLLYPDRTIINIDDYKREESVYLSDCYPVDTVVSSRGCPFNCYFCSSKFIWERRYSFRSIDNIIGEIKLLRENFGTRGIYFREDNFTVNKERVMQFCDRIKRHSISWICESRVDTLDEPLIEKIAASGCKGIWFGIESTDDKVLKRIGKGITIEQVKNTINLCNQYGIRTGGGFMLGFPFDDRKSIKKNFSESKKLNLSVTFYNRVWAIPISQMYYEIVNRNLDYYTFENIILPSTEYLSADEVNSLYFRLVSKKEVIDKKLNTLIGKELVNWVKKKFPFIVTLYRALYKLF